MADSKSGPSGIFQAVAKTIEGDSQARGREAEDGEAA